MNREALDSLDEFVKQLTRQYTIDNTNTNKLILNPSSSSPTEVEKPKSMPGDLLGELYIAENGDLYFHPETSNNNYKDDIFIKTVDDIKKIRTKKLLKA
jgi:hypothetical protein